jgi:teichuronic acid biosynthesis glycosyltransferase TuaG
MNGPKVSVIMPAFNAANTISESIESVLSQTYGNWELIVIDDGSKDTTSEIVRLYQARDSRILFEALNKNGGLPNARNVGCRKASGEFIAFLDSDDLWAPDKLNQQVQFHLKNPGIEISHTGLTYFNEERKFEITWWQSVSRLVKKRGILYPEICYYNFIGVLTVMVKSELLQLVGYFDTALWGLEDQDLWVRISKLNKEFGYISNVLAYYRLTPGGMSRRTGKYKRACKALNNKLLLDKNLDKNLLSRNYYRKFGGIYFEKNEFRLARLYFGRAIKLRPFDYLSIACYRRYIHSIVKQLQS